MTYDPKRQLDSEEMADMSERVGPVYALIFIAGLLAAGLFIWSLT